MTTPAITYRCLKCGTGKLEASEGMIPVHCETVARRESAEMTLWHLYTELEEIKKQLSAMQNAVNSLVYNERNRR
jgi:hypothetical protein